MSGIDNAESAVEVLIDRTRYSAVAREPLGVAGGLSVPSCSREVEAEFGADAEANAEVLSWVAGGDQARLLLVGELPRGLHRSRRWRASAALLLIAVVFVAVAFAAWLDSRQRALRTHVGGTPQVKASCDPFEEDIDYLVKNLGSAAGILSAESCRENCQSRPHCGAWTWGKAANPIGLANVCFFKALEDQDELKKASKTGVVSGLRRNHSCSQAVPALKPLRVRHKAHHKRKQPVLLRPKKQGAIVDQRGFCLTALEPKKSGGKLALQPCDRGAMDQEWEYDFSSGWIKNRLGLCLNTPQRTGTGGRLQVWRCMPNDWNQQWAWGESTGQIIERHGICLTSEEGADGKGGTAHLASCDVSDWDQHWRIQKWSHLLGPLEEGRKRRKHKLKDEEPKGLDSKAHDSPKRSSEKSGSEGESRKHRSDEDDERSPGSKGREPKGHESETLRTEKHGSGKHDPDDPELKREDLDLQNDTSSDEDEPVILESKNHESNKHGSKKVDRKEVDSDEHHSKERKSDKRASSKRHDSDEHDSKERDPEKHDSNEHASKEHRAERRDREEHDSGGHASEGHASKQDRASKDRPTRDEPEEGGDEPRKHEPRADQDQAETETMEEDDSETEGAEEDEEEQGKSKRQHWPERLHSGRKQNWTDHPGTLFCFALMLPDSYEQELLAMQYRKKLSLFGCDAYTVYSRKEMQIANGLLTSKVDTDMKCDIGGEFKTALNLPIFKKVWEKVITEGMFKEHDWTVKVDPDTVFLPFRLRAILRAHPDKQETGVYLNNCKFGMHGPLEVFSRQAIVRWGEGAEQCFDHFWKMCHGDCLWGEDMFIDQCLWKVLNVTREFDWSLLLEDHCEPPVGWQKCQDDSRAAFHPYKSVDRYEKCVQEATTM